MIWSTTSIEYNLVYRAENKEILRQMKPDIEHKAFFIYIYIGGLRGQAPNNELHCERLRPNGMSYVWIKGS